MSLKDLYDSPGFDFLDNYLNTVGHEESEEPVALDQVPKSKPFNPDHYRKDLCIGLKNKRDCYNLKTPAEKERHRENEQELKDFEEKISRKEISINIIYQNTKDEHGLSKDGGIVVILNHTIGFIGALLYLFSPNLTFFHKVIVGACLFFLFAFRVIPTALFKWRWSKEYKKLNEVREKLLIEKFEGRKHLVLQQQLKDSVRSRKDVEDEKKKKAKEEKDLHSEVVRKYQY